MLFYISSLDLAETSLPPTGAHDTSPWAYLFNFLRSGFPRILGAIVLLMTVNILHRDKNFGTVKTTLSAPPSRGRYLFRKLTLGFAAGISVTVLPQVPAFLILGIKHGFRGLGYPVLVDRYVLSNFTVFPANTHFTGFLDANLSKIPNSIDIARLEFFDFIPLWQFLGLAAVQILFFILFCTALAMLISVLVKNEVIAHLVAAGIFAVGSALGKIVPALSTTAWDLFSMADVVPLLEGSLASSYPSSLLTLALASILLVTAGAVIFRRQDIISN
jgi:ABC-type transport system involved in multi-copper enzyme maturation permease subunit